MRVLLECGGDGVRHAAGVAERDLDPRHAQAPRDVGDAAVQRDERLPTGQYLDVAPDEPDDTDSERLADRLLGGEAGGVAQPRVGEAVTLRALLLAEEPLVGARQPLEQPAHARGLGHVDAEAVEQAAGRDRRKPSLPSRPFCAFAGHARHCIRTAPALPGTAGALGGVIRGATDEATARGTTSSPHARALTPP
jgi:hypothetical protein